MEPGTFFIIAATLAGVVAGALLAGSLARSRREAEQQQAATAQEQALQQAVAQARALALAEAEQARSRLDERTRGLEAQLAEARADRDRLDAELRQVRAAEAGAAARVRELEALAEAARKSHAENQARLEALVAETEKRFSAAFEALAGRILEEKTAKFTETNRVRLNELLNPFQERLQDLKKKVEETHAREVEGQSLIKHELERLMQLNQQVSADAQNLTNALKGDSKTQGNWGEMILEKALESSGLERDREYVVQDSRQDEDGGRRQPDVVIRLPDNRHLVIDSKVSLVAYERYVNADSDEARGTALNEHMLSIRNHIRQLGDKNYPSLYGLDSVDFVLLFVAVEPALLLALRAEPDLYEKALQKDVVLVSPANLLATLRVVNHVWRLERQNRNVEEIAKLGGLLYDGFVNFVDEVEKVRKAIGTAGAAADKAFGQLSQGGTSLVRRAERLRELGVRSKKLLPPSLTGGNDTEALPQPSAGDEDSPPNP